MLSLDAIIQIIFFLFIVIILVKPLGWYMSQVYQGKPCGFNKVIGGFERWIYRICGINPEQEMDWKNYLIAMLIFNFVGMLILYFQQRLQVHLFLNTNHFPAVAADLAFNTSASFVTNTNWQAYAGETTLSYLTQMSGLTVQNFLSAATGMAILMAFIRGIIRHEMMTLGNFWVDVVRGILYILLPISLILSIALVSQGVIQNFKAYQTIDLIQPFTSAQGQTISQQIIPQGPVASQEAIKELGTNGGGFFNANSAHPFENPTPISNILEMLAILLIPSALCYTFGTMVNDKRQGWAILAAMFIIFIPFMTISVVAEQQGNPALTQMHVDPKFENNLYPGGNMEGKETRFGIVNSALWAAITTATSCGAVNSMHDSYTPIGGLIPLWLMHLGEIVFGGVGSGLYGMLMMIIMTVFIAGLMVGRTPEYLQKKIEPFEMKMASISILIMPMIVLIFTAIAVLCKAGSSAIANPGAHGFTEILYALTSMSNNNGSAFAGLYANNFFYNTLGGFAMLIGRYWIAIPTVALAGSLVKKKIIPITAGTLPTHTPLFIFFLIAIVIIVGALSFLPALALGPIVEHLLLWGHYGR